MASNTQDPFVSQIQHLLATHAPDGIATRVKSNKDLALAVTAWPASTICANWSEKIYCYVNSLEHPPVCACGQSLTFVSITTGYREFCSRSCDHAKSAATQRRIAKMKSQGGVGLANPKSRARAQQTNLEKYGVANPFQQAHVIANTRQNNPMKDSTVINKIRTSCHIEHGVDWHIKRPEVQKQIQNTNQQKYNVSNPAQISYSPGTLDILTDVVQMTELFRNKSISEIASDLLVSETTVLKYLHMLDIRSPTEIVPEKQISTWLIENNCSDFIKTRKILSNGQELDLFSSSKQIAIEYCGLYWHSSMYKTKTYHLDKLQSCKSQNIKLITIFEDEWLKKRSLVESRLRHALGLNSVCIPARKLTVKKISNHHGRDFLNTNHISGYTQAKQHIGAFDSQDCLRAVMSFSKPRQLGKQKSDIQWEMIRFSTDGQHYPGIAAKLFKFFVQNFEPTSVISYADLRWGEGQYLTHLGFTRMTDTPPNYWYFSLKNAEISRYHRFTLNKQQLIKKYPDLVTPESTELSLAIAAGFQRIWDCGNAKWIWQTA